MSEGSGAKRETLQLADYDPMVFGKETLTQIFADVTQAKSAELDAYLGACDVRNKSKGERELTQERRLSLREEFASGMSSNVAMWISFALLNHVGRTDEANPDEADKAYDEATVFHRDHYEGLKTAGIYASDAFYRAQVDIMEALSLGLIERMKRHVHEHNTPPPPARH